MTRLWRERTWWRVHARAAARHLHTCYRRFRCTGRALRLAQLSRWQTGVCMLFNTCTVDVSASNMNKPRLLLARQAVLTGGRGRAGWQALVLVPTRELCEQASVETVTAPVGYDSRHVVSGLLCRLVMAANRELPSVRTACRAPV